MIFKVILAAGAFISVAMATPTVPISGGTYSPVFRDEGEQDIRVPALIVDKTPVTNEQFLSFVRKNPEWRRSKVPKLFADKGYLSHWKSDLSFPKEASQQPVVWISWFAAKAYCEWRNMRLPTISEWEYFSDLQNSEYESEILKWYSVPTNTLAKVGQGAPNKFGVQDTWGLIWEWVDDFSSVIMSGDSRGVVSESFFCGAASLKAKDPSQYAAFLRFAFRSSLQASYGTSSLGFRCVQTQGVAP